MLAALKPPARGDTSRASVSILPARRTGLGSALINQMLRRIDEDALPAFLDTSEPENLGYYERYPPPGHEEAGVSDCGGMKPRLASPACSVSSSRGASCAEDLETGFRDPVD